MEIFTDKDLQRELRATASKEGYRPLALRLGYSLGFINKVANGKRPATRELLARLGYEVVYRKRA